MKKIAAFLPLCVIGLSACTQPAPPGPIADPYANRGADAIYQGDLIQGTLGAEATTRYFREQVGDTVLFAANQTNLSSEARSILVQQAEWLNTHQHFTAVVQGHAEETGTREYNLALGARRASAVQEYLVAQGVASDRIRTVSFGKERPAEVCSDESCYTQNRRAITVVSDTGANS